MLASIMLVSERDAAAGQSESAGQLAASLLTAPGYAVTGLALVPSEQLPIEAALMRHAQALHSALIVTIDLGCSRVREATASAAQAVSDIVLSTGARATCALYGRAMILSLPGDEAAVYEGLSSMLPVLRERPRPPAHEISAAPTRNAPPLDFSPPIAYTVHTNSL